MEGRVNEGGVKSGFSSALETETFLGTKKVFGFRARGAKWKIR